MISLLRIERAVDQGERDLIAKLGLARLEVERLVKPSTTDDRSLGLSSNEPGTAPGRFEDLWDEPEES